MTPPLNEPKRHPLTYEERASLRDAVDAAAVSTEMTVWHTQPDCDCTFAETQVDVQQLALNLVDSPWFAAHAKRIRVETLREAAAAWPTVTRDMVSRGHVRDWLLDCAAGEAGEPRVLPAGRPVVGPFIPLVTSQQ